MRQATRAHEMRSHYRVHAFPIEIKFRGPLVRYAGGQYADVVDTFTPPGFLQQLVQIVPLWSQQTRRKPAVSLQPRIHNARCNQKTALFTEQKPQIRSSWLPLQREVS